MKKQPTYRTLADYIRVSGVRQEDLAVALGIAQSYLSRMANGHQTPALPLAVVMHRLTGVDYEGMIARRDAHKVSRKGAR